MDDSGPLHLLEIAISFGDCDPAGIVYYPNYFRWFDRCFHSYVAAHHGGHDALRRALHSRGLGLVSASGRFRTPGLEGELLRVEMRAVSWSKRTMTLGYIARVGERVVIEGEEVRAIFVEDGAGGIKAGSMEPFREMVDG
ncbi:MAG: acyl-CoA thioesterase [Vannielia sp.]|uniref:acyl-CoA thioesterase n=1 Tax=Vannielia sp. TaxID=2813045 RepID=UPI003B8E62E5